MMRSLYAGVSGLKTHQTKMDVIGNNIANVNTVAFKSQSVTFQDVMYQTTQSASGPNATTGVGGTNPKQIGLGVTTGAISTNIETPGATQTTNNPFDVKISGDSFFVVNDGTQNYFTKAGNFTVDAAGNLVMSTTGYNVMGWQVDDTGVIQQATVSPLQIMSAKNQTSDAEATRNATISGIINKNDENINSEAGKIINLTLTDALGYKYNANFSLHTTAGLTVEGTTPNTFNIPQPTAPADATGATEAAALAALEANAGLGAGELKVGATTINGVKYEVTVTETAPGNFTAKCKTTYASSADALKAYNAANPLQDPLTEGSIKLANGNNQETVATLNTTTGGYDIVVKETYGDGYFYVKMDKILDSANKDIIAESGATFGGTLGFQDANGNAINSAILVRYDPDTGALSAIDGNADTTKVTLSFGAAVGQNRFEDIEIDLSNSQMKGSSSTVKIKAGAADGETGKGRTLGKMTGLSIQVNGMIYGSYDNGDTKLLGQIAVAQFANASGLQKEGDNLYSTTLNSGEFDGIGSDITTDGGGMATGVLEMSNVDLSSEFTEMITTQRGFQANSRIITVSDTLIEELVNLKR